MKIGFIDSGLGGARVLKTALEMGLTGDIYFLADLKNNPYGEKDSEYIKKITLENISYLVNLGCTTIVIACNTATAVSIEEARLTFPNIKIFGIEPAIKTVLNSSKMAIVLGTEVTLKERKLQLLSEKLGINDKLILLPANKLVKLIENDSEPETIDNYLNELFYPYDMNQISHIILGCTHYPIVTSNIKKVINNSNVEIVDGSIGLINNVLKNVSKQDYTSITLILTKKSDTFLSRFKSIVDEDFKTIYK